MPYLLDGGVQHEIIFPFHYILAFVKLHSFSPGLLAAVPVSITTSCLSVIPHLYHHWQAKYTSKRNLYNPLY